jgi:hypothetical protein
MQSNGENLNARLENRGVKITASEGWSAESKPAPFAEKKNAKDAAPEKSIPGVI